MVASRKYRRKKLRQSADIIFTLAFFALIWLVWPAPGPAPATAPRETMRVCYSEISSREAGSILYPGHFAFSTPMGFGSITDPFGAEDPLWSVSGVAPYIEPLPALHLALEARERDAESATLDHPGLPSPRATGYLTEWNFTPPGARSVLAVDQPQEFNERGFRMDPSADDKVTEALKAAGELLAFLRIDPVGRVYETVLWPSGIAPELQKAVEFALSRGTARSAREESAGWVRLHLRIVAEEL